MIFVKSFRNDINFLFFKTLPLNNTPVFHITPLNVSLSTVCFHSRKEFFKETKKNEEEKYRLRMYNYTYTPDFQAIIFFLKCEQKIYYLLSIFYETSRYNFWFILFRNVFEIFNMKWIKNCFSFHFYHMKTVIQIRRPNNIYKTSYKIFFLFRFLLLSCLRG